MQRGEDKMPTVRFTKMNGCGNDFVVLDIRTQSAPESLPAWSKRVCDRRFGIGADGVLTIGSSDEVDFALRIFNADGSEAEMCGNGARCAALFARREGCPEQMSFTTMAGVIRATATEETAAINLTDPQDYRTDMTIKALSQQLVLTYLDTGVPHAVAIVDGLDAVDVDHLGRAIRQHKAFEPRGTNVDFVQIVGSNEISMRTYERGVEAETAACGTGAVASAIVSSRLRGVKTPVQVRVPGGLLIVDFEDDGTSVRNVQLSGDTEFVFEGQIPA